MRQNINFHRRVEEMKECKFTPSIIGFEYDNSNLPKQVNVSERPTPQRIPSYEQTWAKAPFQDVSQSFENDCQ